MRLSIRVFLCGICIGVAYSFFIQQPLQKFVNDSDYLVVNKAPTGSVVSRNMSTGKSLNDSENIGYGFAILLFGCSIVLGVTRKEKYSEEKVVPKKIFIFGILMLLLATFYIAELTYYSLLHRSLKLAFVPILLSGLMFCITGAGLLSLKKWAWKLSLVLFSLFAALSIYSYISHRFPYSLIFFGVWISIIAYLFFIKRQYLELSGL